MAQHAAKGAQFQAVTANALTTGAVVYLAENGTWVPELAQAAIADGEAAANDLLEKAMAEDKAVQVIGIYLFEVVPDGTGYKAASVREAIRAQGPTVRLDLGKQTK